MILWVKGHHQKGRRIKQPHIKLVEDVGNILTIAEKDFVQVVALEGLPSWDNLAGGIDIDLLMVKRVFTDSFLHGLLLISLF